MRTISALLSIPLLLAELSSLVTATAIDCKQVVVDKRKFDLSALNSVHQVYSLDKTQPPSISNTTWSVNICKKLPRDKKLGEDQCKDGTTICGIVRTWNEDDDPDKEKIVVTAAIPIAGHWDAGDGQALESKWTRLKTMDTAKEGLQLEMWGKQYGGLQQKAVIEMQCDRSRSGNDDKENDDKQKRADDEEKDDGHDLQFVSYGEATGKDNKIMKVLNLKWRTKHACENYKDGGSDADGKSWGFFTWFILVGFLCIAAYLIFGSWLNYNRYGARGWDLLPHGDTIRDIPYLVKDWGRKVVDTVSGGGPRGGYSAV